MSYNKTIWTAGDVITAEKLNNIENGIEAAEAQSTAPLCEITTTKPASATIHFQHMVRVNKDNSNLVYYVESDSIPAGTSYCIPVKQADQFVYSILVTGAAISSVTINNTPVAYDDKAEAYVYEWRDISYPESISIVIVSNIH